jgi:hypothetical protein
MKSACFLFTKNSAAAAARGKKIKTLRKGKLISVIVAAAPHFT